MLVGRGGGPVPIKVEGLPAPQLVAVAADLMRYLLTAQPERLRHSEAVAERAQLLTASVSDEEAPLLVAAAWLHDIGYAASLRHTGFHPLDGALHLLRLGWPMRVCSLVAHHSGARFVAVVRGVDGQLVEFPYSDDALSDALATADQTAGPGGRQMTVPERLADMLSRHGPESPNAKAHSRRQPYLLLAAERVMVRLDLAGIGPEQHQIL